MRLRPGLRGDKVAKVHGVPRRLFDHHFLTSVGLCVLVLFMFADAPAGETSTADPSADRAERHLRALQELAEIGMDLARLLRREAVARAEACPETWDSASGEPAGLDLGLKFSRIARAVRQTLALEARLAEYGLERTRRLESERRAERSRLGAARKAAVRRVVEHTIDADANHNDVEGLLDELDERLDDGRDDADYADRPVGELVACICRDLGVTPEPLGRRGLGHR